MTKLPQCPQCGERVKGAFARGMCEGIRILTQAVARGDMNTAIDLIRMAYQSENNTVNEVELVPENDEIENKPPGTP